MPLTDAELNDARRRITETQVRTAARTGRTPPSAGAPTSEEIRLSALIQRVNDGRFDGLVDAELGDALTETDDKIGQLQRKTLHSEWLERATGEILALLQKRAEAIRSELERRSGGETRNG